MSTASSLRSATRAPLSTPLSPLRDTVTLLPLLPTPLLPLCTSLLLKSNGANIQTLRNQIIPSFLPHPRPCSQSWLLKIFLLDQIQFNFQRSATQIRTLSTPILPKKPHQTYPSS